MSSLTLLTELDTSLFAELDKSDELDEDYFEEQLVLRADLLQKVIAEGSITADESNELVARSRRLKDAAEKLQQQLGEQLKKIHKGRRSVQAYQSVKHN